MTTHRYPAGHGGLALPAFLPDATRAGVRGVTSADLRGIGVPAVVVNTFHLLRRPGVRAIQSVGGVHRFMDWDGPVLSDSGGFQVYSLIRQDPRHGVIRANEVIFREPDSGEKWTLTPERVVQLQFSLGSDIIVCLDDCTDAGDDLAEQERAVERTIRWARRCKEEHERLLAKRHDDAERPRIFGVVQGGASHELRRHCAAELRAIGFDGFGFGGWPLAPDGALLADILGVVADALPPDKPKHALGVGRPDHVVAAHALGYTMFDCSLPTRDARHNRLYVYHPGQPEAGLRPGSGFYRTLYILDAKHHADPGPIDPGCDCPACRSYSRAYLHHLFKIGDHSGERLATLHNLRFYVRMLDTLGERAAACGDIAPVRDTDQQGEARD